MMGHLISKLPAFKVADWGCKVSVCIALICKRSDDNRAIVTASDQKVTFNSSYSADRAAIKSVPFGKTISVLFAGDDVEHATPILDRAFQLFADGLDRDTVASVAQAIDQAFGERLHAEITRKVLRKRGFDINSFIEKGKQKCTPSAYLALCNRIDQVSISLKFLVCGFDRNGDGEPHIYCVDGESAPQCYDSIGMWAIGAGAYAAMSWLAFHQDRGNVSRHHSVESGVYFALSAKFMAETAGTVGKSTFGIVHERSGKVWFIPYSNAEKIRSLWTTSGVPRVPANIDSELQKWISEFTDSGESLVPEKSTSER